MKLIDTTPWFKTLACVLLCFSGSAFGQRAYLIVDRATGEAEATSSTDLAVHGYSITSPSENLNVEGWNSLTAQGGEGWTEVNPNTAELAEITLTPGGLSPAARVPIGAPVNAGILPTSEDIGFQVASTDGTASSIIDGYVIYTGASPIPTITVDRGTGGITLSNSGGYDVDGFSIQSGNGLLLPEGLAELDGFANSPGTNNLLFSTNWEGSISFPNDYSLGNVFNPAGGVALTAEDLVFSYTRPGMTESFSGAVEYTGAVNDLTLVVDESTGQATIQHMTPNVGALELTGYSILSASEGLSTDAWTQLGGDFTALDPRADAIAEARFDGATAVSNGTSLGLGNIFAGSARDLVFEYSTSTNDKAIGSVQYVFGGSTTEPTCNDIAAARAALGVIGDLNGDGAVDFPDFLTLSGNFNAEGVGYEGGDIDCSGVVGFPDFLSLSGNFGAMANGAVASVPEPTTSALLSIAMLLGLSFRRKR